MAVFNSLGSNYSFGFVWKSLFTWGSPKDVAGAEALLKDQFGGETILTYKGRQALELALRLSGLPTGSKVGINGFTCYVVYQAVENAGLTPVFLDVEPGTLHFGVKQLKGDLKAIIVQNTLGLPAPMPELKKHCGQDTLIIEDLAHSLGARYSDGREAGKVGDLTMLSFSQDKPLDVVAGGALVDRRGGEDSTDLKLPLVGLWQRYANRKYPFWTALIRGTYPLGIGRYLHFGLKKLHWLATPMSDNLKDLRRMSNSAAHLLVGQLAHQEAELTHRRAIAEIYQTELPKSMQYKTDGQPSYLRFPIHVDDRASLVAYLKKSHIYIGDTWYDAPIAPARYLDRTSYKTGQCPDAEKLAAMIVNLPTHRHVTTEVAQDICAKINQWSQQQK